MDIQNIFGGIDIYLFDQIQKGRFEDGMKILDVGCGNGRNLDYLMQSGYDVYGIDESQTFINNIKFLKDKKGLMDSNGLRLFRE